MTGSTDLQALINAFDSMPGHSEQANLTEVVEKARMNYGFSGDIGTATQLLRDSTVFEVINDSMQKRNPEWACAAEPPPRTGIKLAVEE